MRALVAAVLLLAAPAHATSDAVTYCRDILRAERLTCRAEYQAALADCAWTLAYDRWIGLDTANADAVVCRQDAGAAVTECRAEIFCEVQP